MKITGIDIPFDHQNLEKTTSNRIQETSKSIQRMPAWDKLDIAGVLLYTANDARGILKSIDKGNPFDIEDNLIDNFIVHRELKLLSHEIHRIADIVDKTLNSKLGEKWGSLLTPQGDFFYENSIKFKPHGLGLQEIKEALQEIKEYWEKYQKGEIAVWMKGIVNLHGLRVSIPEEIKKFHEIADEMNERAVHISTELTLQDIKKLVEKKIFTRQPITEDDIIEVAEILTYYLLESKEVEKDKEWIQEILKFIQKQKCLFVKDPSAIPDCQQRQQYKTALKCLKIAALTIFKERIIQQQDDLVNFWANFAQLEEEGFFKDDVTHFAESQLNRWTKKLTENKPVSFPKWYHCTKSRNALFSMINAEIEVRHQGEYLGAFVANLPSYGFGEYGLAMSEKIEETATKKHAIMPVRSLNKGRVNFGHKEKKKPLEFLANQWIGFQSPIPLKRPDKQKDPLGYYEDNSLSYIFQRHFKTCSEVDNLPQKVPFIGGNEVEKLRRITTLTDILVLPKEWEGHI